MTYLLLAIGGVLGALCRYHISQFIQVRRQIFFPIGTFVVNLSGSLLLGLLGGLLAFHPNWPVESLQSTFGIGFCATYTTFSSFIFETLQLWRLGRYRAALLNVLVQPLLGCLLAWIGLMIGEHL